MSITTEHNGYPILYTESDNLWRCMQLDLQAPSLAALRALIDHFETDTRKLNIPAFLLDHSGFSITPVLVVRSDRDGQHVWIVNKVDSPRGERREKVALNRLVEDTPENRILLLEWRDASRAVYEEGQRVVERRDSIPRITPERTLTPAVMSPPPKSDG